MCGSLASECRSRNGATNKTRTCKTTPVSTISVRGPFVARWCGSVEQICTRRQCKQKCQQQCRASLIELSLLVALSQPRIKLRRVAGQCTASLVKARSGQVDASPGCRLWRLRLHPWAGRGRGPVPCRRAPASVHLIEADQGLPPHGATPPPPAGGREGVCGGGGCSARADRRLCRLARWPVSWLPPSTAAWARCSFNGGWKCHLAAQQFAFIISRLF